MKASYLLTTVVLLLLLTTMSCKKETISQSGHAKTVVSQGENSQSNSINGVWNLVQVSGGIIGANQTYSIGEVMWTIDSLNSSVEINYASTVIDYSGFAPGTYNFQTFTANGFLQFEVDGRNFGTYTILGNELLVDQNVAACGLYYKFVR